MPMTAVGRVPSELLGKLASELAPLLTLADVLGWARRATPPRQIVEIVTQDEYTHDVVLALDGSHFLVFDATWLGSITAVAVWDHRPDAAELLEQRLARGWRPTATQLKGGAQVLGYAACVVASHHRHSDS